MQASTKWETRKLTEHGGRGGTSRKHKIHAEAMTVSAEFSQLITSATMTLSPTKYTRRTSESRSVAAFYS